MSETTTNTSSAPTDTSKSMPSGDAPDYSVESVLNMPDGMVERTKMDSKGAGNFTRFAEKHGGKLEQWIGQSSDPTLEQNEIMLSMAETRNSAFEAARNGVCHAIIAEWVRMATDGDYQRFIAEMEHIPSRYMEIQTANAARLENFNRINRELQDATREMDAAHKRNEETIAHELANDPSVEKWNDPDGPIQTTKREMDAKADIANQKIDQLRKDGFDWAKSPQLKKAQINQQRVYAGQPTVDNIITATEDTGMYMLCLSGPNGAHMIGLEIGQSGFFGFGAKPYRFIDPNTGAMFFDSQKGFTACLQGHWDTYLERKYSQHCCIYRCSR